MQHLFRSVRRSLVFRNSSTADNNNDAGFGDLFDKIGSSIRKSRLKSPVRRGLPSSSPAKENIPAAATKEKDEDDMPHIRWRRGELIGSGAFGRVYMRTNLDTGELLAVKQVLIAVNGASKEKAQAHIRELEKEVKLLKNLSHVNIVISWNSKRGGCFKYFLEFVPGGSITSHLGEFGSFPESVIRRYTKQLLVGLEYLHKNGIIHRDIKGANIFVDNKGCIKLAHFGASTKVVELATMTMTGAKSMKGTPHWMTPEVIHQTGHNFSADIWSVGCTVIEMATGKPPWSQSEVMTAMYYIGSTNSPPPIPEHLSEEAKDFLHKCLQKEPNARASASELLQHPFVMGEYRASQTGLHRSVMSFNPVCEPEDWPFKIDDALEVGSSKAMLSMFTYDHATPEASCNVEAEISAFLEEKAFDLKESAKSLREMIWMEELDSELEMERDSKRRFPLHTH